MSNNLLKETKVAAILSIDVGTLRKWRWAGCGPTFIKVGTAVRYDPDDLQAYIDANRRKSTSDTGEAAA